MNKQALRYFRDLKIAKNPQVNAVLQQFFFK